MLLREAAALSRGVKPSATRRFALACSFEPLHLKTYLQAACALRFPEETPTVETFGYDQLPAALERTAGELKNAPAALVLSWEDLHPALTWRARGPLGGASAAEVSAHGQALAERVAAWVRGRPGVSLVILPPRSWLPPVDAVPGGALGPAAAAAAAALWSVAAAAAGAGARTLALESALNYRDLLIAGHPLPLEACEDLASRLVAAAYPGDRRKAVVVDLDGTLWNGVIGEDGPQGVKARSEGAGHAHFVLQKFLAKLKGEGTLLAFCSKNNSDDVLPHFDALGMPLRLADFAASRCNWDSKVENLRAISRDLNVGTDALVFVDDNQAELAEVRAGLPEVLCLAVPREGKEWLEFYARLQDACGAWRVGAEDRLRSEALRARPSPPPPASGGAGHLKDLQLRLTLDREAFSDPRSLELINKTNQFNLTGERLSQDQWLELAGRPGAFCVSARLTDRFGDFGTVCVAVGEASGDGLRLRQFVLSCRAFGRCVESLVLGELAARATGERVRGPYRDTGKNEPARRFLAKLGWDGSGAEWMVSRAAALAAALEAVEQSGASVASLGGAAR